MRGSRNGVSAAKAKEAALAQYDTGIEVILAASEQAASGEFRAGEKHGAYVIAEYGDQNDRAPRAVLGSVVFRQAPIILSVIKSVVNGTAKEQKPGVKEGLGTLVQNSALMAHMPAAAPECVNLIEESFAERNMRIPEDQVIGRQNAAKDIDPATAAAGGTQ
jgi:basic membrane protein A and related proteins